MLVTGIDADGDVGGGGDESSLLVEIAPIGDDDVVGVASEKIHEAAQDILRLRLSQRVAQVQTHHLAYQAHQCPRHLQATDLHAKYSRRIDPSTDLIVCVGGEEDVVELVGEGVEPLRCERKVLQTHQTVQG